ncbi:FeS+cluster+biogenesis+protein,+nifU-like [Methylocapsa aurea]|uniref:nitrogen fixation protein NifU n=1 Tax=Methylocapsa aurea TaxID=663610 RepID=UPI003D18CD5E
MSGRATSAAEGALRRVEDLVATLEALPETHARVVARQLMEAILDLHGVALARMSAIVAASGCGDILLEGFGGDERVAAVLLLHGLHPEMPQARVKKAIAKLAPSLRAQGADIALMEVIDGVARLRLRIPGASREEAAILRRQVEDAIVEAAPDLDEIAILNEVASVSALSAAS